MTNRREFLHSSAALLAAGCLGGRQKPGSPVASSTTAQGRALGTSRLPIGFSTLGCPKWTLTQAADFASTHRFSALELRGVLDEMDLTRVPELTIGQSETKQMLADHGLRLTCLGSSAEMHHADPAKRAAQLDEGRRFIDLAQQLGTPFVRVFGNSYVAGEPRATTLARIASGFRELGDYSRGKNVTVLIESHGDFTDSPTLLDLMHRIDSSNVAILWDAHHTFASGKEEPEYTVRQIARYIRHTHLKDSVPAGNDRRYVLTGMGDVPVKRQVAALVKAGYQGYYNFEWEKRWHPEIDEPEIAFAHYASVMTGYLRELGVMPRAASR